MLFPIRQMFRRLRRAPGFSVMALATLALGIGATAAIFAVIDGVILKPLPYRDPERLIGIWHNAPAFNARGVNMSPSCYFIYREQGTAFEDVGLWSSGSASITGVAEPEQVPTLYVSDGVLPILGIPPAVGRWFTQKDDSPGNPETAVLSYSYWQRRFGGQSSVIGRRILVDGKAHEVIGVMPERFQFLDVRADLFLPNQFVRAEQFLGNFSFVGLARLKPGVTIEQANTDIARMIPIVGRTFQSSSRGMPLKMFEEVRLAPALRPLKEDVVGDIGNILWVLLGTIAIVLLIACANVANLLLVRAESRRQEMAIRAALGAGWIDRARELLFESLSLWLLGGLLGLAFAFALVRLLITMAPAGLPRLNEITIDPRVLLFTLAIALLSGVVFGFLPVFRHSGGSLGTSMRESSRGLSQTRERHRTRNALVVIQVALALVLLTGSGLMIRTASELGKVQPGFQDPQQVLTLRISIPETQVRDHEQAVRMFHDIRDRIAALPGVTAASVASAIPLDGGRRNDPIWAEGHVYQENKLPPIRRFKYITPAFFSTIGTPLKAGRDITWQDVYGARKVVLLSENLARELWGSATAAVGKRVRPDTKSPWYEVIGVVYDVREDGIDRNPPTLVYWPHLMKNGENFSARRTMAYAIRSPRTGAPDFLTAVRQAVWSVNSALPVANVRTLEDLYRRSLARTSFTLVMLALAGGMALILGVIGIYAVLSYAVTQRTREIGIRVALGAQHSQVRAMFVRKGLLLSGIGVTIGLIAAAGVTRFMAKLLYGVSPLDPLTYISVAAGLVLAAMLASYVPARRATAVDPVEALRSE